ncbi:hypothetical protein BX616_002061 [Lobosporangium transversale]|uniref:Uncharacterized protein n=1 Tax=Lobosporangium transversale TaxID=64571 RepID=A0A1Y2GYN4_9FUNG|nr:hypothetical protein BCR41DRAFT_411789 [Lobosporangium transversale]KAF9902030.1 hypothetical protein BX616_002061 [Lobosporangium transversale]ORZ27409.1 hypothetical protein BCR41DRAFT_411789 [Lobosporangium transversale]|eukprot:XP_021885136.1 hypothetical protein BCR41DRAFT_411789 [Lobosporangium transversale]
MALSPPPTPLSLLHGMKGKDLSTIPIPDIKQDLERIKAFLDDFLKWVGDYLNNLTSLYAAATREKKALINEFLDLVEQYCDKTLPALYGIIDQIRVLMNYYEYIFKIFIGEADKIILALERLLNEVLPLQEAHEAAIKGFVGISLKAEQHAEKWTRAFDDHTKIAEKCEDVGVTGLGITAASLGITFAGWAAYTLATISFPPLALVTGATQAFFLAGATQAAATAGTTQAALLTMMTNAAALTGATNAAVLAGATNATLLTGVKAAAVSAVATGAGGICSLSVAAHNSNKAKAYFLGATHMLDLVNCCENLIGPIVKIKGEFNDCKDSLEQMKDQSILIAFGKYPEGNRREQYKTAKGMAIQMKELCKTIAAGADQVTALRMSAELRKKSLGMAK